MNPDLVENLERKLLHVWPSVEHVRHGPWVLRFAHGFSARANSASALARQSPVTTQLVQDVERYFTRHGLPPQFRLSPLAAAGAADFLAGQGYTWKDTAITMTSNLGPQWQTSPGLSLTDTATDRWLQAITALSAEPSKRNPIALKAITQRMKPPVTFATVREGHGYGIGIVHDSWLELSSLVIAPTERGKGLGRALVERLQAWGYEAGARRAFLQVDTTNAPARSLYKSLGFTDCYSYSTWRKLPPSREDIHDKSSH